MRKFLASFLGSALLLTGSAQAASNARHYARPVHVRFVEHFASGLSPEVDLRPKIAARKLAIRDQGDRGTCTVFATTFLIEYQKAGMKSSGSNDLSEEFLNWAGNKVDGTETDGGFFTEFMKGFSVYGISTAKEMPYRSTFDPGITPSSSAQRAAETMFPVKYPFTIVKVWNNQNGMTSAELQSAMSILRSGRPVATGIWWQTTFATVTVGGVPLLKDYPRSANSGSNPPMFDGHSIDLVGFRESKTFPGGGYFIFRNSFGPSFGDKGYGFVSFQYLLTYANDAIAISSQPWPPPPKPTKPPKPRHGGSYPT
jgi:C1A family cysteine protease